MASCMMRMILEQVFENVEGNGMEKKTDEKKSFFEALKDPAKRAEIERILCPQQFCRQDLFVFRPAMFEWTKKRKTKIRS